MCSISIPGIVHCVLMQSQSLSSFQHRMMAERQVQSGRVGKFHSPYAQILFACLYGQRLTLLDE